MRNEKKLRGEALYKAIVENIKELIIEQNLRPGDALPSEGQLARDLGIGRGSVREAVKSLQSLGIIDVQHGTGLYVRELNFNPLRETIRFGMQFNARTISELLQIRIWLEAAVIGEAVTHINTEAIKSLENLLIEWAAYNQLGKSFTELDEIFHRTLYSVLGNETLMNLFDVFWDVFRGLEIGSIFNSDPDWELLAHRQVLEAVKARDSDMARVALLRHFEYVKRCIEQYRRSLEGTAA